MQTLDPNKLTVHDALAIAKHAILDVIGDDSYELCRLYHEDGVSIGELAERHRVTRQRVYQRINATHATLRRLSIKCGISLMPKTWESAAKPSPVNV